MGVAGDSDAAVDDCADESPDEARDLLRVLGEDEEGEGERVDVGAVIADDGQGENDDAEVAEVAQVWNKGLMQEATNSVLCIGFGESRMVDCGSGFDLLVLRVQARYYSASLTNSDTEHLSEAQREHQPNEHPHKYLDSARIGRLITCVIGGI